jgi:hypothetical protein
VAAFVLSASTGFGASASGGIGTSGGGTARWPGPPDGDPDAVDDPQKKKRNKEIDWKRKGKFAIDSDFIKQTKNRPRGNIKCEFEKWEHGTHLTIKDWINQMET